VGAIFIPIGIWWFLDAIAGGQLDGIIGGLIWKGPLLMAAGAGAAYYGYRIMTDPGPNDGDAPTSKKGS
jgi:hypothetical protein